MSHLSATDGPAPGMIQQSRSADRGWLRRRALTGVRWTALGSVVRASLQFAQVTIMAHLLQPADFGLVALVTAVQAFLQNLADAGVSNAIIHHQVIDESRLSGLYWVNVLTSCALAALLCVAAPFVAVVYGHPQLQWLFAMSGVTLVSIGLGQQLRVVAQKRLAFGRLATVDLPAQAVGFVVSVASGWAGAGVYALALGSLSTALAGAAMLWAFVADGWRPRGVLRLGELAPFLRFGAWRTADGFANTLESQADVILGASLLGAPLLGVYSLAKSLSLRVGQTVNPIATTVAMPVMAKAQGDRNLLAAVYLRVLRMVASTNVPLYAVLGLYSPEVVRVLLGPQWRDAVPLLRVFAAWGLIRATGNPVGALLMATGRPDLSLKYTAFWAAAVVPFIWVGSHWGALGVAYGLLAMIAVTFLPTWRFQVWPLCGVGFAAYARQVAIPAGIGVVACLAGWVATGALEGAAPRLLVGVTCVWGTYLGVSAWLNRPWLLAIAEMAGIRSAGDEPTQRTTHPT